MPATAPRAAPGDNPDADEARTAYRTPARALAEAELGGNELDATVKVCRACQNGAQRLYHIGRLGRVAQEAAAAPGARCVPPELVAQLAQDDDGEVRAAAAAALPGLACAAARLPEPRSSALALVLLDAAFELVEDDVDAVVAAAEAALPALASALLQPQAEPATAVGALGEPLARLAASEEEEVRASAARLAGALAPPLGPQLSASHMLPLAAAAARDSSFRVRKAAAGALAAVAPALGPGAATAAERCLSALGDLSRDGVWTVRKAAAEALPAAAAAPALPPAAAAAALSEAMPRLCADAGEWVRNAALCSLGPALRVIAAAGGAVPDELLTGHYAAAAAGDETGAATAAAFCDVAEALGARRRWPQLRGAFAALARSPDRAIRAAAAAALPRLAELLGEPAVAAAELGGALRDALADAAPEVQVAALRACVDFVALIPEDQRGEYLPLVCALAVPPALPPGAAAAGAVPCGAWRVREAAARALPPLAAAEGAASPARGALAAETALPAALAACRDPVAAVRSAAACAAAPLLAAAAGDGEAAAAACAALRQLGSAPDYLLRLSFVAACDGLAALACAGGEAARQLLLRELAPLLLSLAHDDVASVRCALAAALGRHGAGGRWDAAGLGGGSEPRAALGRLATDDDAETRRAVGAARVAAAAAAAAAAPAAKLSEAAGRKMPLKLGLLQRRGSEQAPSSKQTAPAPMPPQLGAAAPAAEGSGSAPPPAAPPPQQQQQQQQQPQAEPVRRLPTPPAGSGRGSRPRPALQPGLLQRRSLGAAAAAGGATEEAPAAAAALRRLSLGTAAASESLA